MHYYDCPCDECHRPESEVLLERARLVIERLEQELERPRLKEYERALSWLAAVCGGPDAVTGLDARPLRGPVALPDDTRVREVEVLLRRVATDLFDAETEVAFLRGLARVWELDPGLVRAPVSASYVAAGVAWAIGEANGTVGADRRVSATRLKYALDTPSSPGIYARPIRRALLGPWVWQVESTSWPASPPPDLSPFGDLGLLTSRTRRQLIRVRDHALAARATDREAA